MKRTPRLDKSKLPYSLLLDPLTQRAAAYTNTHLPITELASQALLDYAAAHVQSTAAFDPEAHAIGKRPPEQRPLPEWATPEVLERCKLVWIARPTGDAPAEDWLAIPPR